MSESSTQPNTKVNSNQYARDLQEAILRLTNGHKDRVEILICIVKSVDANAQTCTVTTQSGPATVEIEGVSLTAEPNNDGLVLFPSVDSTVLVVLSNYLAPYVLFFSNIDKVKLITANGVQFGKGTSPAVLGDKNGEALSQLAAKVDAIFNAISSAVVVPMDGGASLKATILATLTTNGFPISPTFGTQYVDPTKSKNFKLD